jgi:O-antigen ligase
MGERLNYWRRSLQAIRERPVAGFGVGSWNMQYNRLEGGKGRLHTWNIRNPHQEFLLWMVEAGILGMLMIGAVFGAAIKDSLRMHTAAQRAAQSAVLAIGVSCLFNASLYDAQVGDYLCVALAIVLAFGLRSEATASANGTLQAP